MRSRMLQVLSQMKSPVESIDSGVASTKTDAPNPGYTALPPHPGPLAVELHRLSDHAQAEQPIMELRGTGNYMARCAIAGAPHRLSPPLHHPGHRLRVPRPPSSRNERRDIHGGRYAADNGMALP